MKHYIVPLPPEVGLFQYFCDSWAHTNKEHFQMAVKDQEYPNNNALWLNASLQKHHHLSRQYFTTLCPSHGTRHDVPCQMKGKIPILHQSLDVQGSDRKEKVFRDISLLGILQSLDFMSKPNTSPSSDYYFLKSLVN